MSLSENFSKFTPSSSSARWKSPYLSPDIIPRSVTPSQKVDPHVQLGASEVADLDLPLCRGTASHLVMFRVIQFQGVFSSGQSLGKLPRGVCHAVLWLTSRDRGLYAALGRQNLQREAFEAERGVSRIGSLSSLACYPALSVSQADRL